MSMSTWRTVALGLLAVPLFAGHAQAEDTHFVKTSAEQAKVGSPAKISVVIEGRNGWHLNEEAPITLKVLPPPGVDIAKPKMGRSDLTESTQTKARFDLSATLAEAGVKTIPGEAAFVVCQETACKPVKESLTLTVVSISPDGPAAKATRKNRPAKRPPQ